MVFNSEDNFTEQTCIMFAVFHFLTVIQNPVQILVNGTRAVQTYALAYKNTLSLHHSIQYWVFVWFYIYMYTNNNILRQRQFESECLILLS